MSNRYNSDSDIEFERRLVAAGHIADRLCDCSECVLRRKKMAEMLRLHDEWRRRNPTKGRGIWSGGLPGGWEY